MRKFTALFSLILTCCAPTQKVSEEAVGATKTVTESRSCGKAGYCYSCLPGYNLKLGCGFKLSPRCPGQQIVTAKQTPMRTRYDSGEVREWLYEEITSSAVCS